MNFVTIFNFSYILSGLALHNSMLRVMSNFTLWIVCYDEKTYEVLSRLKLRNMKLIKLAEVENSSLLKVKSERNIAEYCWTLTPFLPDFVFSKDSSVSQVTYIDADLWFRKDPVDIFEEFSKSKKNVLITDHGYSPEYDYSSVSGKYCVQFMVFKKNLSQHVLKWWQSKCIDWCFAYPDNGRFGDQKYLDNWTNIFNSDVHVLSNFNLTMAPWNANSYNYINSVFWHFHGLKILSCKPKLKVYVGSYHIPKLILNKVYLKYLDDLCYGLNLLNSVNEDVKFENTYGVIDFLRDFIKTTFRRFNFFSSKKTLYREHR